MGNAEHLRKFTENPSAWDEWRREHSDLRPDLTGESLSKILFNFPSNCQGVDFNDSDLRGTYPSEISFDNSTMRRANAEGVIFHRCYFRHCDLTGIRAKQASFHECVFDDAILSQLGQADSIEQRNIFGGNVMALGSWLRVDDDLNSTFENARFTKCSFQRTQMSGAYAPGIVLHGCDFTGGVLSGSFLNGASCTESRFDEVIARRVNLVSAELLGCSARTSDFADANLSGFILQSHARQRVKNMRIEPGKGVVAFEEVSYETVPMCFTGSDLRRCDLSGARIIDVDFANCMLDDATVYGVSAWNVNLHGARQNNLVITRSDEPRALVDDLGLAQFVYLLMSNATVRRVIETLTSRVVLLLGRFNEPGLDTIRLVASVLRERGYVPLVYDWAALENRTHTETVGLLAGMAKFVLADISEPRSVPQELQRIIPNSPSVVVQPLLVGVASPYGMFSDFLMYQSVMKPICGSSAMDVCGQLQSDGILAIELRCQSLARSLREARVEDAPPQDPQVAES